MRQLGRASEMTDPAWVNPHKGLCLVVAYVDPTQPDTIATKHVPYPSQRIP